MTSIGTDTAQEAMGAPTTASTAGPGADPDDELGGPEAGNGAPDDGDVTDPETGEVTEPTGLRDEKELDRAYERLRREHDRHENRVKEIVGADWGALAPCPLCSHFAAGYIGLVELPESAVPTLRAMLGMPDLSTYVAADDAGTCPRCEGRGQVLTGSVVPGYETKQCRGCAGIGWAGAGASAEAPPPADGQPSAVTGPTVYGLETDDPQVTALRERGFTVIPPMRVEGSR